RADTLFIASVHADAGADASHRGGQPGFVRVLDERRLLIPDYAGNTMFQTLGNIAADPRVGLLFVDFDTGATLQLTGRARILWEPEALAPLRGADRALEGEIDEIVEIEGRGTAGLAFRRVLALHPALSRGLATDSRWYSSLPRSSRRAPSRDIRWPPSMSWRTDRPSRPSPPGRTTAAAWSGLGERRQRGAG